MAGPKNMVAELELACRLRGMGANRRVLLDDARVRERRDCTRRCRGEPKSDEDETGEHGDAGLEGLNVSIAGFEGKA
jgi:hypothetical protein